VETGLQSGIFRTDFKPNWIAFDLFEVCSNVSASPFWKRQKCVRRFGRH
jgi:hypothetical protein